MNYWSFPVSHYVEESVPAIQYLPSPSLRMVAYPSLGLSMLGPTTQTGEAVGRTTHRLSS